MMKTLTEGSTIKENNVSNILKGIVISMVITFLFLFLFSIILTYTNIQETTIAPVIIIITAVSILIGSSLSTVKIKKNGIINGGIIGFSYIFLLYVISSIIQSSFSLNIYTSIMIIFSILAGMVGGIVGVNIKK